LLFRNGSTCGRYDKDAAVALKSLGATLTGEHSNKAHRHGCAPLPGCCVYVDHILAAISIECVLTHAQ
jgi:hypothetical protein